MAKPRDRATASDEIDLVQLLGNLWAGKGLILLSTLIALVLGLFVVLRAVPVYQAEATMQIEARSGALGLPEGMQELLGSSSSGAVAVETETEILKSRMVVGEAVRALNLQLEVSADTFPVLGQLPKRLSLPDPGLLPRFAWGNESIVVGELIVPQDLEGEELRLSIIDTGRYRVTLPEGGSFEGEVGKRSHLAEKDISLLVDVLEGPVGRGFTLTFQPLDEAVRKVQENFAVSAASRNASILKLSYTHRDPKTAEKILDAIAAAYVVQNISRSAAEAENSLRFIDEQLPLAQEAMNAAQEVLNRYRQQQSSVDVDYETRSLLERATAIEAELNALSLREEELKKRYTINHPTYQLLLENRATLERRLEGMRAETANLPETQKEIFNLSRDLEVASQVYTQLLNRSQELRVVRASTVGSVRVVDPAYAERVAVSPKLGRSLALALVAGLIIGIGLVLLRRFLHRGIRGAEEIEAIGLPVFGTVSFSPEAMNNRSSKGNLSIHALSQPDDLVTEAIRSLRTALHFGMLDAQTNSVLLTSAAPSAGKSFTAVNLAVVSAQAGQKVCLIDADLRRGYLRRYIGRPKNTPGLAEYLAQEKSLDEVLLDGPVDGLKVITSGRYPPNPSELLMRSAFEQLLLRLNEEFDLILIDSPPTLAVTDPVVIGRYAGASIMVVRHLETMLGEVEAVRQSFETAGAKITGAILNGYKQEEGSRYGGYQRYYNYRYTYAKDPD